MRLEAQKYLFDVLEALNLVAEYCTDETYERQIVSFRNLLVHGYQTIDDFVVWEVVTSDLGNLRSVVEAMLEEGESP